MRSNTILITSFNFALRIIRLSRKLQQQREFVISNQLLRAGTSIGAQVEEAQAGQSRRDFVAKMAIESKGRGKADTGFGCLRNPRSSMSTSAKNFEMLKS